MLKYTFAPAKDWMRTPEKYGAARVLWAGDAEAREGQNRASGP